jgi:hypothetical protein
MDRLYVCFFSLNFLLAQLFPLSQLFWGRRVGELRQKNRIVAYSTTRLNSPVPTTSRPPRQVLDPESLHEAAARTGFLLPPREVLATFSTSSVRYHILSRPVYADLAGGPEETIVRQGCLTVLAPQIVTPYYLQNLFAAFPEGLDYARSLAQALGEDAAGVVYPCINKLERTAVESGPFDTVTDRIASDIGRWGDLEFVVRGVDDLWDVSLAKSVYEIAANSLRFNLCQLGNSGLLDQRGRVPWAARAMILELFRAAAQRAVDPIVLKTELDRWGVFAEYEERFLSLFRTHDQVRPLNQ